MKKESIEKVIHEVRKYTYDSRNNKVSETSYMIIKETGTKDKGGKVAKGGKHAKV